LVAIIGILMVALLVCVVILVGIDNDDSILTVLSAFVRLAPKANMSILIVMTFMSLAMSSVMAMIIMIIIPTVSIVGCLSIDLITSTIIDRFVPSAILTRVIGVVP
jgi:hypothetical protein